MFKRIVKEPATENYLKAISKEALRLKLKFKDFVLDKKRVTYNILLDT